MQRVRVTARNFDTLCRRCLRKVGEVGKFAFTTSKYHNKSTSYCQECGPKVTAA